ASLSDFSFCSCIRAIDLFLLSCSERAAARPRASKREASGLETRGLGASARRSLADTRSRHSRNGTPPRGQNQPPIVRRPAIVVVLVSPVRSTSSAGPNPRKKCSAGKNMSGANRLIARFDAVTLASTPEGRSSSSKSVLVLVNEKPTRGHTDKKGEKAML